MGGGDPRRAAPSQDEIAAAIVVLERAGIQYCSGHGEICKVCGRRSREYPYMLADGTCNGCLHDARMRALVRANR